MFFLLWLKRFFLSRHQFIRFTPLVSIISLILASSSLVLAMSVYSGYESTVRQTIVDMTGHLVITSRQVVHSQDTFLEKIKPSLSHIEDYAPFITLKSLLVYEGKLSGVLVEGVSAQAQQTVRLRKRLIAGALHLKNQQSSVIGRGIAKKFNLNPGDFFHIVVPEMDSKGSFQNKYRKLYVEGVLDFGFHAFNSRHIIVNRESAQSLLSSPEMISGLRLLVNDPTQTELLKEQFVQMLGASYRVSDWQGIVKDLHKSYFEAVRREKVLIFLILMVLVLAGAFNVSSHLAISVLNQIREISILKVMGASQTFIFSLLLIQGFLVSFVGALIGIGVGFLLSKGFISVQNVWQIIPEDVYKINTIITEMRFSDILLIFICSQLVCLMSCLLPAWRALKLPLKEGLLYE